MEKKVKYIEVEFKSNRKTVYKNPQEFPFRKGDLVIVQAEKGIDLGIVHLTDEEIPEYMKKEDAFDVMRRANEYEIKKFNENRNIEESAVDFCKERIKERNMDMQLLQAEYQFDRNKLTFYFTADKRIDFRELVKDLAMKYKTRIELRQIGVRDRSKRLEGCGVCGLKLCCASFIREFNPISTQFAKMQNLSINPAKLSGLCGKLKCCLRYEKEFYEENLKDYPELDTVVEMEDCNGVIEKIDVFSKLITVRFEDEKIERYTLNDLKPYIREGQKITREVEEEIDEYEKEFMEKEDIDTRDEKIIDSNDLDS